jgi:peptidyl-prolyl cis-trans isomerase SurA
MKKACIAIALSLSALISTGFSASINAAAPVQSVNGIAAIVNKDVITDSQLQTAIANISAQMKSSNAQLPSAGVLHKQVLEQIINQELALQIAKRANVTVSDTDVDNAITHIAGQNHMSLSALKQKVLQTGQSYIGYKKEIHKQLLVAKVQQQAVGSKVSVTQAGIDKLIREYNSHQNATREYHTANILIPVTNMSDKTQVANAQTRAEETYTKLHKGADFSKIAKLESSGPNALQGGDMGWSSAAQLPNVFVDQLSHMKNGQVSKPIQAGNGFHILKLLGVKNGGASLTQGQARNILLQQNFEKQVHIWIKALRKTAYIKIM